MLDGVSESGQSPFDLAPLTNKDLVDEYQAITDRLIVMFVGLPQYQRLFEIDFRQSVNTGIETVPREPGNEDKIFSGQLPIPTRSGEYFISRISNLSQIEISINRNGERPDSPNMALESIRLKLKNQNPELIKAGIIRNREGYEDSDIVIEYHRSLKKGRGRTIRNNALAAKKIGEFLTKLDENI